MRRARKSALAVACMFVFWVLVGAAILISAYACLREAQAGTIPDLPPCLDGPIALRVRWTPNPSGDPATSFRLYSAGASEGYSGTGIDLGPGERLPDGRRWSSPIMFTLSQPLFVVLTAYNTGGESKNHSPEFAFPQIPTCPPPPPPGPTPPLPPTQFELELSVDLATGAVQGRVVPQP